MNDRQAWRNGLLLAGALVIALTACGSTDPDESSLPTITAAVAAEAPGSPPPTTTPLPVAPLTCGEPVVTIAERLLIERRQRMATSDCVAAGALPPAGSPGPVCWDRCTDGRSFADFALDPEAVAGGEQGDDLVLVPYAARYVDDTGAESTEAETLRFERAGSGGGWLVTGVTWTDLGAERDAALATLDRYFDALERGDDARAARLLLGAAPTVPGGRDDLGRLADEGMLAGDTPDDLARAVDAWCRSGAACRRPDAVRTEVTPRHTVRVVATYRIGGRDYEVVYSVTGDGGVDEVFGLPPRP